MTYGCMPNYVKLRSILKNLSNFEKNQAIEKMISCNMDQDDDEFHDTIDFF